MDPNIVIALCTVISTLISMKFLLLKPIERGLDKIDTRLDRIDADLTQLNQRVSRIEGYLQGRDYPKTGTDKI